MSRKGPCDKFKAHQFIHNDSCRDCGFPEAAHPQTPSASPASPKSSLASRNWEAASRIDRQSVIIPAKKCSHYVAHNWIFDRCRDCGRPEGDHESTSGPNPVEVERPVIASRPPAPVRKLSIANIEKHIAETVAKPAPMQVVDRQQSIIGKISIRRDENEASITSPASPRAGSLSSNASASGAFPAVAPQRLRTRDHLAEKEEAIRAELTETDQEYEQAKKMEETELQAKKGTTEEEAAKERYAKSMKTIEDSYAYRTTGLKGQLEEIKKQLQTETNADGKMSSPSDDDQQKPSHSRTPSALPPTVPTHSHSASVSVVDNNNAAAAPSSSASNLAAPAKSSPVVGKMSIRKTDSEGKIVTSPRASSSISTNSNAAGSSGQFPAVVPHRLRTHEQLAETEAKLRAVLTETDQEYEQAKKMEETELQAKKGTTEEKAAKDRYNASMRTIEEKYKYKTTGLKAELEEIRKELQQQQVGDLKQINYEPEQAQASAVTPVVPEIAKIVALEPTDHFSSSDSSSVTKELYGNSSPFSLRATDLVQSSWLAENDTIVGLFAVEGNGGGNGFTIDGGKSKVRLIDQTEYIRDTSDPVYEKQFSIDKKRDSGKLFMLRVYDVEGENAAVTEDNYLGLAVFAADELINTHGSIQLPLVHPSHSATNALLDKMNSSINISLHRTQSAASSVRVYTRLALPLSVPSTPSPSTLFELALNVKGLPSAWSSAVPTVSLWARSPVHTDYRYLGHTESAINKTFVVGGGDDISLRVAVHDRRGLRLSTSRITELSLSDRTARQFIGSATFSFKQVSDAVNKGGKLELKLDGLSDLSGAAVTLSIAHRKPFTDSAALSPSDEVRDRVVARTKQLLSNGDSCTSFLQRSSDDKIGSSETVQVWEKNGTLFWSNNNNRNEDSKNSIAISSVTHIIAGKQNSAFLTDNARSKQPQTERCLSIISSNGKSVHLELSSWQLRDAWAFALLHANKVAGGNALWISNASASEKTGPMIIAGKGSVTPISSTPSNTNNLVPQQNRSPPSSTPTSPTSASPSSEKSEKELSEVMLRLERLFETGRHFLRHMASRKKPVLISLWLKKEIDKDGKRHCILYWSKENDRTIDESRSLKYENISAVVLHKQSIVFRRDCAEEAPAANCFSLIPKEGRSLHLQAFNERDAETWAFGLASLMKQYAVRPRLFQPGQFNIETEKRLVAEAEDEKKEIKIDGEREINLSEVKSVAESLQQTRFTIDLSIKCRSLPNKHNQNIVCVFDVDNDTERLTYLAQSEKQTKTANPDFRKKFALDYQHNPTRKLRFNVYDLSPSVKLMEESERIGSAVVLLKEVIDGGGIDFVYKLSHEDPNKQAALVKAGATIVVQCIQKVEHHSS